MHLSEMLQITFALLVAVLAGVGAGLFLADLWRAINPRKQS